MSFNPLDEKGMAIEEQIRSWKEINSQPYDKNDIHPYTKTRIILMNGIEVESTIFLHQYARHCDDPEIKQKLAQIRRMEQQQQKRINWLTPSDESALEVTIGYEQVAVDLTAWLARTEKDTNVKQALDFALLEDFDHLYRYADLLEMDKGIKAEKLVGEYTEIMPGRPTIAEHRHPFDSVNQHYDKETADILTKLHVLTIIAGEQQTMNFYMNIGNRYDTMLGRSLYAEIAQVEEQHVSHYETLQDPTMTWAEGHVMHEYNECYLYYSLMEDEIDSRIKKIWEEHLEMEIKHLKIAGEILKKVDKKELTDILPGKFPELLKFQSNKDYIRKVLKNQTNLTKDGNQYVDISELSADHRFFNFQKKVNKDLSPSHDVIKEYLEKNEKDYRFTSEGEHPVAELRDRKKDNTQIARSQ